MPRVLGERIMLREYRAERMALFTDNKILAGWNGLLLMALSRAARKALR